MQRKCGNRFHLKPQSPKHKKYCGTCRSHVAAELHGNATCPCCGEKIKPRPKHAIIKNILNRALYHCEHIVLAYDEFHTASRDVRIYVHVYYKGFTYRVPLSVLCRYREAHNGMSAGSSAGFWSEGMLEDCSIPHVLGAAKRQMSLVGIGR